MWYKLKYEFSYALESGVTLGGIGAGSFELRADGRAYEWQIFNNGPWASRRELRGREYLDQDSLFFAARVSGGKTVVRLLRSGKYYYGASPYTLPWLRPVESATYIGEPPFAELVYRDGGLNRLLDIRLEAFSPFIPGDLKASSLPVAVFRFKLKNLSGSDVEVSLAGGLRSPFEFSRILGGVGGLLIEGDGLDRGDPRLGGSMFLGAPGGDQSVAVVSAPHPMRTYYEVAREFVDAWVQFRSKGIVEGRREYSGGNAWALVSRKVRLAPGEEKDMVFVLSWFFPNHADEYGEVLGHYYEKFFKDASEVYRYVEVNLEQLYAKTREFHDLLYGLEGLEGWVADLVGSQLTSLHKLTWLTRDGRFGVWEGVGEHYYTGPEAAALNTTDVTTYILPTLVSLFPELAKSYIEYNARYQLSKDSPYYLVYALAYPENRALFIEEFKRDPSIVADIGRALRVVGGIVEKTGRDPAGRIMHFFSRSLKQVDSYHMVELMPKFILDAYLVSSWTGDLELLRRLQGNMRLAYESVVKGQSLDGVLPYHTYPAGFDWTRTVEVQATLAGLPTPLPTLLVSLLGERGVSMGFQSFDVWSFYGVSAYTSIAWLGALRALQESSKILGYSGEEYSQKYMSALGEVNRVLWNGEYFRLWFDPVSGGGDEACMAAQLLGQWLSTIANIGYVVDRSKVVSTLKAVARRNLVEEEGLLNGVYPDGVRPALSGPTSYENPLGLPFYPSIQMDTPWSGVEFAVASHMLYEGLVEEALNTLRVLHERYVVAGHYWNHVEWGAHYMRPLSSWSVVLGAEGLVYNGFTETLRVSPAITPLRWVFAANGCWGLLAEDSGSLTLEVRHGSLRLRSLRIGGARRIVGVQTPSRVGYQVKLEDWESVVTFESEVVLDEGGRLVVVYG